MTTQQQHNDSNAEPLKTYVVTVRRKFTTWHSKDFEVRAACRQTAGERALDLADADTSAWDEEETAGDIFFSAVHELTGHMSEAEFYEKYQPIDHTTLGSESADWCQDWDLPKKTVTGLKGIDVKRIWTVTEEDGYGVVTAGVGYVNRLYFIVTKQPWEYEQQHAVLWTPEDFDE